MKILPWLLSSLLPLSAAAVFAQGPTPAAQPDTSPSAVSAAESPSQAQSGDERLKSGAFTERHVFNPPANAGVKDALNVRGQPAFKGEVVAHLHKGDKASVLELLTLRKPHKGEPAHWARITLPDNTPVWVMADYIDSQSMTIRPNKVNLRGGPGENYSVLGRLEKGAKVKELGKRNGWIQIEAPAGAFGFVDADYLDILASPAPAVADATPAAAPVIAPAPGSPPEAAATPAPQSPEPVKAPPIVAPEPTAASATPAAAEISPSPAKSVERVISREGVLHRAYNIQAPADYELRDAVSGEVIDFIQAQPNQNLKGYVGATVMVTGAEVLDRRWPRTPVLKVQTVDRAP